MPPGGLYPNKPPEEKRYMRNYCVPAAWDSARLGFVCFKMAGLRE
jgi:hypothetical protein